MRVLTLQISCQIIQNSNMKRRIKNFKVVCPPSNRIPLTARCSSLRKLTNRYSTDLVVGLKTLTDKALLQSFRGKNCSTKTRWKDTRRMFLSRKVASTSWLLLLWLACFRFSSPFFTHLSLHMNLGFVSALSSNCKFNINFCPLANVSSSR